MSHIASSNWLSIMRNQERLKHALRLRQRPRASPKKHRRKKFLRTSPPQLRSSSRSRLLDRDSLRTGHADHASGSLDQYSETQRELG